MHQDQNLEKIPLIQGKYGKAVLIDTNARLGVSLLYSCTPERTAGEIAAEFELVELDSLMNSSAAAAKQKRGSAA